MKVMLFFLMMSISVFAQDFEPGVMLFKHNNGAGNETEINKETQEQYITGFECSHWYKFDELYKNNTHFGIIFHPGFEDNTHNEIFYPLLRLYDIEYHIDDDKWTWEHHPADKAVAIEWEPTLEIPENERGSYIKEQNNDSNYVFGFSDITPLHFSGGHIR